MVEPSHHRRRAWQRGAACLIFLAGVGCLGCRSGIYSAAALPERYQAPHFAATRAANLTRLAQARPNIEQIFTGDVLEVAISTGLELRGANRWVLRVAEDGSVTVPLVGPVQVAGMLLPQAEETIRNTSVSRGIYRNPQVALQVTERRSVRVSVSGEVNRPGDYDLPVGQADVLAAIAAAGGLRSATAGDVIDISHPGGGFPVQQASYPGAAMPAAGGTRQLTLNLHDVAARGQDLRLQNGSVVVVGKMPPRSFSVIGLVRKPGQFEGLNERDIYLLDAIAMAGGRTLEIADKVRIYRTIEGQEAPVVIDASVGDAKMGGPDNVRLAPGDVVSVEETALTFAYGAVRGFTRMSFGASVPLF